MGLENLDLSKLLRRFSTPVPAHLVQIVYDNL
jgi:hypothetical protein